MSERNGKPLPAGWVQVPLGELGTWSGGGTPSKFNPEFWDRGTVPWVSPKDMKCFEMYDSEDRITESAVARSSASIVPPGTVLMVTRSGILRHTFPVAVSRVPVTMNQDLKSVTPFLGISATYVARALQAFGQRIIHTCVKDGTTVQSIEVSALKSFLFPLAPEKEQQRISDSVDELLSDLDAGVAALERARAKLKQYRAAVLKAAVEGALTAEWRARHPVVEPASELLERILAERRRRWEAAQLQKFKAADKAPPKDWKAKYAQPVAPDTTNLPELPRGWCWATVEQLSSEVRNGYGLKPDATNGVPILRISSVRPFALDLNDRRYLSGQTSDYADDQVERGDLLFTRYNGSRNLVGVCAVVPHIDERIVHPDKLIRARPLPAVNSPPFFAIAANIGVSRKYIEQRIRTTAGQAGISGGDVRALPVPLPPSTEQAAIVPMVEDQLSVIEHLEADLDTRMQSATALRQSILRHAFTGQLAPQDPADEPASELLKRIAAEREERARQVQATKRTNSKTKSTKAPRKRVAKTRK